MLTAVIVLLVVALGAAAFLVVRPRMQQHGEIVDAPGMRSTLLLRVQPSAAPVSAADDEVEEAAPPEVLDALGAALEAAGADASHWMSVAGRIELHGMIGAESFKLTLGSVAPGAFLLVVHTRTLGRTRWVAPPPTDAMRTVLRAIDHGARRCSKTVSLEWRRRQDDPEEGVARTTPFD